MTGRFRAAGTNIPPNLPTTALVVDGIYRRTRNPLAPLSILLTRQALYQGLNETFEAQVRYEAFTLDYLYRSRDHAERRRAVRGKRRGHLRRADREESEAERLKLRDRWHV
jgi:enoyl-CoA hydratase/carnithine racemase